MELDWENDSRVQFVGSAKCGKSRDEHVFGPVWQSGVTNNASHIGRDGFVRKNADFVCPDYGETSYTTRQETLKNAVDTFMAGIAAGGQSPSGDFIGAAPKAAIGMVKLKPAKNISGISS